MQIRTPRPRSRGAAARRAAVALLVLCLGVAPSALADEVLMKSGVKYEGRIVSEDDTHYVLETDLLGSLRIAKSDVEKAERAAPEDEEAAARERAAAEEARRKAEAEARDAAERLKLRRAVSIRRKVAPAAPATPAPAPETKASKEEEQRAKQREEFAGAELSKTASGTQVIVYEPPHPFPAAPSGIVLGRRSWARFEMCGAATAVLSVPLSTGSERLAVRLSDVQRHVEVDAGGSRAALFDGIRDGDWVRARLDDGATVSGRFVSADGTHARLLVPSVEAPPAATSVDLSRVVQVEGLLASPSAGRALLDLAAREPVSLIRWPDATELNGRFCDRMEHHLRLDVDGDGEPDVTVAADEPFAEVRRLPTGWRGVAASLEVGTNVQVRGYEEYEDARVERVWIAPLASVTAYAVTVRLADGCAVVPFDSIVSLENASSLQVAAAANVVQAHAVGLPVAPGDPAEKAKDLPPGISAVTDGRAVTQVYVAAPYDENVCGLRVGVQAAEAIPFTDLTFGIEVLPKGEGPQRPRELLSDSIPGLRVAVLVDPRGAIGAIEISSR